jgi:hypothetical protein
MFLYCRPKYKVTDEKSSLDLVLTTAEHEKRRRPVYPVGGASVPWCRVRPGPALLLGCESLGVVTSHRGAGGQEPDPQNGVVRKP